MGIDKNLTLCNLALVVHAVLAARHHSSYVEEKMRSLDCMSGPEVLEWAVVYMDGQNQHSLAEMLGLNPITMLGLRNVFEKVRHARPVVKAST